MYWKIFSMGLLLITGGCGVADEILLPGELNEPSASQDINLLSFERTQPTIRQEQLQLNKTTAITLVNEGFQSARRIERRWNPKSSNHEISEPDLWALARQAAEKLFPEIELKRISIERGETSYYVTFLQQFETYEIVGARLILRMDQQGNWVTVTSKVISPDLLDENLSLPNLWEIRNANLPDEHRIFDERNVIYPRRRNDGLELFAAKELHVWAPEHRTAYLAWIDTDQQRKVGVHNPDTKMIEVEGSIVPNTPSDHPISKLLPWVQFTTDSNQKWNADHNGRLPWDEIHDKSFEITLANDVITVGNDGGPDNSLAIGKDEATPGIVNFDEGSSLGERNIYYWVLKAHQYMSETLDFDGLDYQLVGVSKDGYHLDNAYFSPLTGILGFGEGNVYLEDTALSRDIILHEYGHAVTHDIYGLRSSYEFRAMNEAFSDYLAATITDNPYIAEGAMKERAGRKYLRNIETMMTFKEDYTGESFHFDSQLFSGALWRLRKEIGPELADQMVHEARLAQATTIQEFLLELLKIDSMIHETDYWEESPHERTIWKAFEHHGLHSRTEFHQAPPEDLTRPWERQESCWVSSL